MNLSTSIRDFFDALVHPSARRDPATAERHVAFMAPRLCGSLMALGAFPVFLAWHGVPSALEFFVLAWMIAPIAIACFLSRTGRFEAAQALSAFALTCIVTVVAAASGGINSVAAIWLALVPLEAALSGSRRSVAVAAFLAVGGAGLLAAANAWFGLQPGAGHASLLALGVLSALIYATGIALGADGLVRSLRRFGDGDKPPAPAFSATDVMTWHGHGGRIVAASPNALAVLDAPAEDLAGYGLFDRIHVADRPAYLRALSAAAAGESGEIEFRLRRPGGVDFMWVEMRCRPCDPKPDEDGAHATAVAVLRDVTERKNRQDALVAARAEAERANAAKSRLMAVMGHELRTPLNAIIGFSDLLQNEAGPALDGARRREYARIISQSGHHLLAVANDMLDMARLETGHFELVMAPFAPAAVIAGSVELLALPAEEAGVTLAAETPDGLPDMIGDRRAVTRILINLISNAIKFSERGGAVSVNAGIDGGYIAFEIADSGIGMTADDAARIGRPYFRADSGHRRDGAGLGLSIVKELVDLHGGTLNAASDPGKGTRMVVRLPVDCEGAHAAAGMRKRA